MVSRDAPTHRILILADANGATQTISFRRPLQQMIETGLCRLELFDEVTVAQGGHALVDEVWRRLSPTLLVLSRYAGGQHSRAVALARSNGVRVVYHIDDNLFAIPRELGAAKYARYNDPKRLADLSAAIDASDFVYASTDELARQLSERFPTKQIVAGNIYCSLSPLVVGASAKPGPVIIGYMGTSGHAHDLEMLVPALIDQLDQNRHLRFETFGTIKPPSALARFGSRTSHHAALADYDSFIRCLSSIGWHIGLAPIVNSPFNRCKADTKWVEYTAAGIPTIASDVPVYDSCCADGAGVQVRDHEWAGALAQIIASESKRAGLITAAQLKLNDRYSPTRLSDQVVKVLGLTLPQSVTC